MWHSPSLTSPITNILASPLPSTSTSTSPRIFAVSYTDGSIRLWSFDPSAEATEVVTFNGHKRSVITLAFDADGSRLASGGTEGEIVVWDRVAEVGLFRLKGHRGPVTAMRFIPHPTLPTTAHPGFLVSTAKDTYLKLWDLATQHCQQTVVVGRGEVWSCAVRDEGSEREEETEEEEEEKRVVGRWLIITGSGDGEGRAWKLEKSQLARGVKENANGEVSTEEQDALDGRLIFASFRLSSNPSATFPFLYRTRPSPRRLSTRPCRLSSCRRPTEPRPLFDCVLRRRSRRSGCVGRSGNGRRGRRRAMLRKESLSTSQLERSNGTRD